jgi:hypothetical protein
MTPESEAAPAAAAGLPGAPEPEPELRTLDEAEALLEKSRAEIDRLALNTPPLATLSGAPGAVTPAPAPPPAAPKDEAQKRAEKSAAEDASPREQGAGGCETACKAFSSLERASDAVCRLDADGGQRCERARRIREDARVRVASCGCPK